VVDGNRVLLLQARALIDEALQTSGKERPQPSAPELLTLAEYAQHRRASISTVRKWVRMGLPHSRVGRLVRIDPALSDEWLERGTTRRVPQLTVLERKEEPEHE
jgi:excisionase family DNA binding protein